ELLVGWFLFCVWGATQKDVFVRVPLVLRNRFSALEEQNEDDHLEAKAIPWCKEEEKAEKQQKNERKEGEQKKHAKSERKEKRDDVCHVYEKILSVGNSLGNLNENNNENYNTAERPGRGALRKFFQITLIVFP